jgi:glutamate-1-semialdehyde aminotransferase
MDDSFQIQHKARKYIPGGFSTESKKTDALFGSDFEPAYFKSAEGAELIDWEGKRYIDFGMGIGACNLGYNHPVVAEAIENELKKGIVTTLSSPLEPDLAELIVEMFPSIEQVRFLKTGAEACSAAVRLARAYTYREYILASGYFGWHDWCNKDAGVPIATRNLCIEFCSTIRLTFWINSTTFPNIRLLSFWNLCIMVLKRSPEIFLKSPMYPESLRWL